MTTVDGRADYVRRSEPGVIGIQAGRDGCVDGRHSHQVEYPVVLGPEHEVHGRCRRCGRAQRLSNTTHKRFLELGGVCRWERCIERKSK